MWKIKHRLMEAANADGAAAGGGAATAGNTGAGAAAAGSAAGAAAAGNGAANVSGLAAQASAATQGAQAPVGLEFLADKFHVKTADGKLDEAASLRKQAEAYAPLVKRLGTDELRPEKVDGYKFTAPQGVEKADFEAFVKDPEVAKFITDAHAKGYSNAQLQFALESQLALGGVMAQADASARDTATKAYMKEHAWKDDAAMSNGFGAALAVVDALSAKTGFDRKAFTSPMTLADGVVLPPLINDPRALAMLAHLAPELKLGQQPSGSTLPATEIESLMKGAAYMNPQHADHAAVKARVDAHFKSLPGGDGRPRGPVVFSTGR